MRNKIIIGLIVMGVVATAFVVVRNNRLDGGDNEIVGVEGIEGFSSNEVTKTVAFDTEDEMMEYAKKINSIESQSEGVSFINLFLKLAEENDCTNILGMYHPDVRDIVYSNRGFPVYDDSGVISYKIQNINITSIKESVNNYYAEYSVDIIDAENGNIIKTIKRKDKFELVKQFEKIYIVDYERKTISD